MTDRRQDRAPHAVDGLERPGDDSVSRRYRELARDVAPSALHERIRAQARRTPVRPAWQRPLAIAATLALAVALVLQVATPPDDPAPAPAADSPALTDHALQSDAAETREALNGLSRTSRKAAASLAGEEARATSARCAEYVEDAAAWQACIAALEAAGEQSAAERERQAWEARHGQETAIAH
jgi:hypothetical protein